MIWAAADRLCGVGAGMFAALSWRDRLDVLRISVGIRLRQGGGRVRTAAEVAWFRYALMGRVRGLPSKTIDGEDWHLIEGRAAARRVAAGQGLTTPAKFLSDIYIRTEHVEPAYVRLDAGGRVQALMFVREDEDGAEFLMLYTDG